MDDTRYEVVEPLGEDEVPLWARVRERLKGGRLLWDRVGGTYVVMVGSGFMVGAGTTRRAAMVNALLDVQGP